MSATVLDLPPIFVDTAVRAVVLLGLAALASVGLRRASSATRHLAWTLALAGVMALPALRLLLPPLELPVPGAFEAWVASAGAVDRPAAALDRHAEPAGLPPASAAAPVEGRRTETTTFASSSSSATTGAVPAAGESAALERPAVRAAPAVLLVWGAGVLLLLIPLAGGWIGLHRLGRRSPRLKEPRIRHRATRLALRLGLDRSYRLLEGPAGSMPMTFGLFRASIVLPADAADWSPSTLDAVLLHELAHVARRDTATQLLAEIVRALHWFNPLVWVATRRLRVEREHACDDMALAAGPRPSEYADELLKLVRSYRAAAPAVALAMARRADVAERLRAVLDEGRRRNPVRGVGAVAGYVLGLLVVLVCTAAAPVGAQLSAPDGSSLDASPRAPEARAGQSATCLAEDEDWNQVQIETRENRAQVRMRRPGCDFDLEMEGEVELDAHAMTIRRMGPDARLRIEEDARGTDHSLDVRVGRDGAPVYAYERNGREHEFDGEARAWFDASLSALIRQSGFMADARVDALLRQGGVEAVLRELGTLDRSHVFAKYAAALLERAELDEAQIRALVRTSSRRLESDHYMARILKAVAAHQPLVGGLLADYVSAATGLDSDHYRAQALQAALDSDRLTGAQIEQVVRAAGTMDSDHYRTRVLGRLLDRADLSSDDRAGVLRATAMIDSDHYRSQLLGKVAGAGLREPAIQRAFFDVAAGLDSDHYYRQSLAALLEQGIEPALLVTVLESAAVEIDSDHYLSELLLNVLGSYPIEGGVRAAFLEAMNAIDSTHYRGRVADALLRSEG